MPVNGCDCFIVIRTAYTEKGIPYSGETLRETASLLEEEAAIEGSGICKAIRKNAGTTGCIITPLTIGTAPLLFYLAMGSAAAPIFVSETRNLYRNSLSLVPLEDTDQFELIQDRGRERRLFEGCRIKGFELRVVREEAIKLKLDICGELFPVVYSFTDTFVNEGGERFSGDCLTYTINGKDFQNIYGITLISKKEGGTKTELWIKRALNSGSDLPYIIDEMIITAHLVRDKYEDRHFGMFNITLKRLVLTSDETNINSADTVIGPLRYYVSGEVSAEVFSSEKEAFYEIL
jgi:hypothetical protein